MDGASIDDALLDIASMDTLTARQKETESEVYTEV